MSNKSARPDLGDKRVGCGEPKPENMRPLNAHADLVQRLEGAADFCARWAEQICTYGEQRRRQSHAQAIREAVKLLKVGEA